MKNKEKLQEFVYLVGLRIYYKLNYIKGETLLSHLAIILQGLL